MDNDLKSYREHLIQAQQKSIEAYDKSLLSLSGGGLGVSIAFIKDIVGPAPIEKTCLLIVAWAFWIGTMSLTLASFYVSHLALQKTIRQVDEGKIHAERPGGTWTTVTIVLNIISGVLFLLGLLFIVIFASNNMR